MWRTSAGQLQQALRDDKPRKRNKYGARKTTVDGVTFDSQAEANRFVELQLLERAGQVSQLERQVTYVLAPPVVLDGRKKPAIRYRADFRYIDAASGAVVVEDVKGVATPEYRLKRHLMKCVHGIDVKEVRA